MELVHIIVVLLRPIIWGMIGLMITAFGSRFLKNILNIVSLFLLALCIGGTIVMSEYYDKVLDPYYPATSDDWTMCIVGSVTIICFFVFGIGYMLFAQAVGKKSDITNVVDAQNVVPDNRRGNEENKFVIVLQNIVMMMMPLMIPFAIMGYSLPFFLLDSIAGIIVGVIGEIVGILVAILVIYKFIKR